METIKSIIEWAEQTFPDATLEGQIDKFNTEYDEYFKAVTDSAKVEELADVFIVALNISRFDIADGLYYINDAWQLYADSKFSLDELTQAIQWKMGQNRLRTWEKKNGNYQHKGEANE